MALSHPFKESVERRDIPACLLQTIDGVMPLAVCWKVRLKLLNTSDLPRRKPLVMTACPASLPCLLGHFPSIRRVQSSTPTGDFEDGCRTLTNTV